jgi:hypothetical protein
LHFKIVSELKQVNFYRFAKVVVVAALLNAPNALGQVLKFAILALVLAWNNAKLAMEQVRFWNPQQLLVTAMPAVEKERENVEHARVKGIIDVMPLVVIKGTWIAQHANLLGNYEIRPTYI